MNATFDSLENQAETDLYQEIETLIKKNPWSWQSVCAVVGLVGGVIAPFLGATADVITWFINSHAVISYLHVLSIVLCALTLPLLILGAFCLDSLEAKSHRLSTSPQPLCTEATPATAVRHVARQKANHPINRTGILAALLLLIAILQLLALSRRSSRADHGRARSGKVYFELDVSAKPNDPKFSSFVPRVVVGVWAARRVG